MSPAREAEFAELQAYIEFFATYVWRLKPDDPVHPSLVGRQIVEEYGRSKALAGLRQAVNDTVEELNGKPVEYLRALDSALRDRGILTASEAARRYNATYRRILRRGEVRNDTEYYLVAGVLADLTSEASAEERASLEQLSARYERVA